MNLKKIKHISDKVLFVLIIILSLHFCIKCISVAFTHPFSFDGAIIAQISQNMAEKLQFKTKYWQDEKFCNSAIGAPVIFPIAVFFKLFGQSFESGLMVNAIYLILLFFACLYYLKHYLKMDNFFILFFIIVFYGTRELFNYGFGLYGEIPMIFYFVLALIFMHKYWESKDKNTIFWAGVMLGLGFLTKFVFLIVVPGLFLAMAADFFIKRKEKIKKIIANYLFLIAGFILPNLLFELYKLASIGFNGFKNLWYWLLFGAGVQAGIVYDSGGRIKDSPDLFTKVNTHIDLLSGYVGLHKITVVLLLLAGVFLFYIFIYLSLKYLKKKIKTDKNMMPVLNISILFLITVMLCYFIWWIFITPTDRAWHRRIMPGIVLYEICFVILLFILYRIIVGIQKNNRKTFNQAVVLAGLFFIVFAGYGLMKSENFRISIKNTEAKTEILQAGRYMGTFPQNSEFFGFKWWQAPVISFASKKIFKDFFLSEEMKSKGLKNNKYLILDREAMQNQKLCYERILSDFIYELVFVADEVRIYKLTERIKETEYIEECN